nr:MAG TPA: hypothetical protein [Caudoviricetes sp.]
MVEYKYSDLFWKDSIDKQVKIAYDGGIITNEDLYSEEFELGESLCSESELRFGCCEAGVLKFKVANIFQPLKDKYLTVTETINGNTDAPFEFGRYKVYSDKPTADRRYREITAYDAMYDIINAEVSDWYNVLLPDKTSAVTMKQFRTSFISHFGLEQEEIDLVNDSMVVEKTIEPSELSGKDVITAICEINGCFGHIGRNGKFKYVFLPKYIQGLWPANDLYPADNLYPRNPNTERIGSFLYINCEYEDYVTQNITKIQIRQKENDIGAIVGTGNNCYIVEDNFLVYGKSAEDLEDIAGNMFSIISDVSYRPFSAECKGNPCLEVGDAVRLATRYEIIESYVLKRTLKGIQALRDEYEATGEEYRSTQANSVHKSIIQLKGKTNVLTRTIEETNSKITDVESGLSSEIKQTATDIRAEVKNTADGLSSSIEQTASSIRSEVSDSVNNLSSSIQQNAESIATEVKRANEAEGNLSTKITQTAESITSEVSKNYETKENATNTKTELESSIKQTADGFTAELSKQVTETKQYAESAAETAESNAKQDTADKLKDYSTTTEMNTRINATAEGISAEVTRKLQSYSTTEQMNSAIRQTADSINTEVSKKVNGDEIISKINQSAENVSIEANKINLNGAVTANQNFKIGLDGSMEALSGLIGEWQIFNGYLRYVLGENAQALIKPDELLISRSAGANFHAYPGLLYMQSDDGERSISIDCNDGSINLGGSWTTPWGDIEN